MLLAASLLRGPEFRWGAIALLAFACWPWRAPPANRLTLLLGLYCAWLLVNAAFITPAYNSDGLYLPVILWGGFAAIAALGRETSERLFRFGAQLLAVLVLVGLLQQFIGFWQVATVVGRASATFMTPNTFATAINLFLLPLVALWLAGRGKAGLYVLALWLFAGLAATQSRGGMLAFIAGLAFIAVCLGWPALWRARRAAMGLAAGLALAWAAQDLGSALLKPVRSSPVERLASADRLAETYTEDRVLLYRTTLGLILEHPVAGAGANMFVPRFEAAKPEFFRDRFHPFVHNDYLQVWLEYGAPGILLLLALAGAALVLAWRLARGAPSDPLPVACGAALASCFAHAMVDFPLYVPFTAMLTGCYLGALAAFAGNRISIPGAVRLVERVGVLVTAPIRRTLVLAMLVFLLLPYLANLSSDRAVRELAAGRGESGLQWQSLARRLEPRNALHYWAEGVILREHAIEARDRALAARADEVMAEEIRVNPYRNAAYLERARFHMRHPELFESPMPPAEILSWTQRALDLRPYNLAAQVIHTRALAFAGRAAEAGKMLDALLARHPEAPIVRNLAEELQAQKAGGERR